jgi:3-hydroxy-9,10-secoandrosta-1,3,5(10)-triene-9,17-dione monooxygenase reductase component
MTQREREATSVAGGHEYRSALGRFATGVTVVVTRDARHGRVGLTVNSFSSVSLAPPMVLWSLRNLSRHLPAFEGTQHYSINVLAAGQSELANRFASGEDSKFQVGTWRESVLGTPVLEDCVAWFECANTQTHSGGDHRIFIGTVVDFGYSDAEPLVFHSGQFVSLQA